MNEELNPPDPSNQPDSAQERLPGETRAAWDLLREAREAKGVNLVVIASALKVPLPQLKALEAGELSALPDAVFARALVGSVCRHLGIDAQPILAIWPQAQPSVLQHMAKPVRMTPTPFEGGSRRGWSRWWLVGIGLILCVGVAIWWVGNPLGLGASAQAPQEPDSEQTTAMGATQTVEISAVRAESVASGGADTQSDPQRPSSNPTQPNAVNAVNAAGAISGASALLAPNAEATQPGQAPAQAAIMGAQGSEAAPNLAATRPNGTATLGETRGLVVRANKLAWVEVRDASGVILLNRTLAPGAVEVIAGAGPWAIALGNAPETEITRDGKAIDFDVHIRQGIARFQLE